ncbi:MAG: hypothetical protein M0P12_03295 [Paludibacteraceae bacterium]|nr:hypothetical protein [Paludibacteraceae bacterium]
MGIRIHKKIGWAITDLTENDTRINWDVLNNLFVGKDELKKFQDWIIEQDRNNEDRHRINHLAFNLYPELSLQDLVFYDAETWENTIIIGDGWPLNQRTDDGIDYIEDYLKRDSGKKPMKDTVQFLRDGYYPYQQFWMYSKTGEHLYPVERIHGIFYFGSEVLDNRFGNFPQEELDKIIVPEIPLVVSDICEYFKIFTDNKTKLQLRPVLATYWR